MHTWIVCFLNEMKHVLKEMYAHCWSLADETSEIDIIMDELNQHTKTSSNCSWNGTVENSFRLSLGLMNCLKSTRFKEVRK